MNKIDEIRERVNSTDPDKPIVMPWERDDFNYLLGEIERLQAKLKQLMDASRNIEPLLPCTTVGRVRLKKLYDIAEFRGLLLRMEDEYE